MPEFKPYGDTYYEKCPICEGEHFESVWKVPFEKLDSTISVNRLSVRYFPSFGAQVIYEYSHCHTCESIFLNPYLADRKQNYASLNNDGAQSKIDRAKKEDDPSWKAYLDRYQKLIRPYLKDDSKVLVDAACGAAQYLVLAKNDDTLTLDRLIGIELSPIAVEHLKQSGLEAYQGDLDATETFAPIEPDSVDFVIFSEAFEHVEHPLVSLRNMVGILKPGGRLFFSAQRVDPALPVRPGENNCITERGFSILMEQLNCKPLTQLKKPGKWQAVIEKA